MKKRILIMLISAMMMLMLASCGEKKEDLTGVWVEHMTDGSTQSIQLYSDGTGFLVNHDSEGTQQESRGCTWIAENGRIKFTINYGILGSESLSYKYQLKNNALIFLDDAGEQLAIYDGEK